MTRLSLALLLSVGIGSHLGLAQASRVTGLVTEAPAKAGAKLPQTPRELAWQLLDSAYNGIGKAQPAAQAALLGQIGDCYILLDRKKALEVLERAYSLASADGSASQHPFPLQSFIIRGVSELDVKKAAEMARLMPPEFRASSIEVVVEKLLAQDRFDEAIELVNLGSGTEYPFAATWSILRKLKDDDPRRVILFSGALAGYQMRPDREFGQMVAATWEHLPRTLALQGLDAIAVKVATYKEEATVFTITLSGAKGSADLNTEQEIELFDVILPMEALEPAKWNELSHAYPSLKKAHELFPDGQFSAGATTSMTQKTMGTAETTRESALFNGTVTLQKQAEALAASNLPGALDKVKAIPIPLFQAETLMAIARQRIESDPLTARDLLNRALTVLAKCDVNPYGDGVAQAEVAAAGDAHTLSDDELTRRALDLALDTAAKFAKWDADADDPNELPEDLWPSTFSYQNAILKATRIYGMAAKSYLDRIQNTDMYLFSQVALAAALLDREQPRSHGPHSPKKKT